jgi:hypothetical protein
MWMKAHRMSRLADQLWMERMSHPNYTRVMRKRTLSKASATVGR